MAIELPETDVVVIGLGASGGVAVLPLARAGLRVIGLEAGTWMDPGRDYRADEVHNNVRALVTTGARPAARCRRSGRRSIRWRASRPAIR